MTQQSESVWDYPRPPRVEPTKRRVRIMLGGCTIVDTVNALRVLETSHPPVYYVSFDSLVQVDVRPGEGSSFCEFKGMAAYWTLAAGGRVAEDAGWSYPRPSPGFEVLTGHLAVYPGRVDGCLIDDEVVRPQPGSFYGGWVTDELVGPFKGAAGTAGW